MGRPTLPGLFVVLIGAGAMASACADAPAADPPPEAAPAASIAQGSCGDVHGASVCSWAKLEGDRLVGFGLNIPFGSIEDADREAPFSNVSASWM